MSSALLLPIFSSCTKESYLCQIPTRNLYTMQNNADKKVRRVDILLSCRSLTLFFLRRSRRRPSCASRWLRRSRQLSKNFGNRRFWTSVTSTAIVTTTSGKSCFSNRYCTSSGWWGKPSKIKPVDLEDGERSGKGTP